RRRWPDPVALYGGYTASGQLPVLTKRGHYWAPKGGQSCVPIDTEIYVLANNRCPSWGSDAHGAPSTPFTRAMAQILEALDLNSKSCAAQCKKVCAPLRGNEAAIMAIRQRGILGRQLRGEA
ncbi:hypothetical protein, partial [Paracoccus siganidrum]|uniref:hypothetical protein n=1 Tax=Paracoccus siganidrum TaxID=1276757 RepID=UPI001980CE47